MGRVRTYAGIDGDLDRMISKRFRDQCCVVTYNVITNKQWPFVIIIMGDL